MNDNNNNIVAEFYNSIHDFRARSFKIETKKRKYGKQRKDSFSSRTYSPDTRQLGEYNRMIQNT